MNSRASMHTQDAQASCNGRSFGQCAQNVASPIMAAPTLSYHPLAQQGCTSLAFFLALPRENVVRNEHKRVDFFCRLLLSMSSSLAAHAQIWCN